MHHFSLKNIYVNKFVPKTGNAKNFKQGYYVTYVKHNHTETLILLVVKSNFIV